VRIMAEQVARRLSLNRMLPLGAAAALALAVPVALCVVHAESSQTDTAAAKGKDLRFSAVSIRQNKSSGPQIFGESTPDGWPRLQHRMPISLPQRSQINSA
jgi:hypothetical protein